ncbi:MAG: hypothetical protein RI957_391 [Verrucomicrobiota bacterium]|jgi:predicted nucleic acid-binding protein
MNVKKISGRILIDTNVLIYATLASDGRHEIAKKVLSLRNQSGIEMFVSVQNLAEMYPNLTGPKNQPPDSPGLARDKILSLSRLRGITVLPITMECVQLTLDLCVSGNITRQNYFDRQLAALMLREKIPTIITENAKDFSGIDGIKAINPFS